MTASGEIEVHPSDLQQISSTLDGAGRALFDGAGRLRSAPDAGASTGEVSRAMAALASAVAGFGNHLGDLASSTSAAGTDFTTTDGAVGGAMQQRRGVLGP
jgi:hypothetical protein